MTDDIIAEYHRIAEQTGSKVGLLFEDAVEAIYRAWLKPGDNAVDVGAHKGAHLFPMAEAVGPKGRLYAFEPLKPLYAALKKKLKAQRIGNVKLFNVALAQESGTASFNYFENRPAFSGLERRNTLFGDEEGGLQSVTVKCATLDSKLPFFKKISAIKLDIEGGELHALMGARQCLQKSRPLVVFENGRESAAKTYGYTADGFFRFFEEMDMKVFWLSGEEFVRSDWKKNRKCWEFVALPREKTAFAENLPRLCQEVLAAHQSAAD